MRSYATEMDDDTKKKNNVTIKIARYNYSDIASWLKFENNSYIDAILRVIVKCNINNMLEQ